jgi:HD-GYP domain-containing protein (c-di-GMP phosphodiesterase class II)
MTIVPGIEHLVAALREKDCSVVQHSERAASYALVVGQALGLKSAQMGALRKGGILHDIGKLSVSQSILCKPGPLTRDEWAIIRDHPVEGHKRLQDRIENSALEIVLSHHEWYDGRGYPGRAKGEEIPILARIFSIADAFDAMTSRRPRRPAMPPDQAREEVLLCAGTQFDPVLVDVFCSVFDEIVLLHDSAIRMSPALAPLDERYSSVLEAVASAPTSRQ